MPNGQAITSAQGTIVALGADGNQALSGAASTSAPGTQGSLRFLPLRSRKAGTGTATIALSGASSSGATGTLVYSGEAFALVGSQFTGAQGTLLYRGRVTISWNANSEPDLAGYRIYHGTVSHIYDPGFVDAGNVTSYVYGGLLPGFTHYFMVRAYDTSNNESGDSAEVSKTF